MNKNEALKLLGDSLTKLSINIENIKIELLELYSHDDTQEIIEILDEFNAMSLRLEKLRLRANKIRLKNKK